MALILPIGLSAPDLWFVSIDPAGRAHWFSAADSANEKMDPEGFPLPARLEGPYLLVSDQRVRLWGELFPGEEQEGFNLRSRGLPTIRRYSLRSSYHSLEEFMHPDWVSLSGYTVGPTAPAERFVPEAFAEELLSQQQQASHLGWISPELSLRLEVLLLHLQQDLQDLKEGLLDLAHRGIADLLEMIENTNLLLSRGLRSAPLQRRIPQRAAVADPLVVDQHGMAVRPIRVSSTT